MAGNIIPAIATTNAIISGLIVLQALHLLRKSYTKMRNVHLQFKPAVPLSTISLCAPNPACGVCRDTYVKVLCDSARARLGDVVSGVLGDDTREVSVYEEKRVLSDPDWEDNNVRTLESLNVTRGKFLMIVDEEGDYGTIAVALGVLPYVLDHRFCTSCCQGLTWLIYRPDHPADAPPFVLPSPLPQPPRKVKPMAPLPVTPRRTSVKRSAPVDDDDILEFEPSAKRVKPTVQADVISSPSKKRRLEEDGLILMEGANDKLEDDVIEID